MNEKVIAQSLGIRSIEEIASTNSPAIIDAETTDIVLKQAEPSSDETIADIDTAKDNIKSIIEQGQDSLTEVIALAKQSESIKGFEVAAILIKSLTDANKSLVDIALQKKKEKGAEKPASPTNITNNNLILSTSDMLKILKGEK